MSKEKFQRTKPHVNIGLIILILAALVYVYAAGDMSLWLKAQGQGTGGESEFGLVEANWIWVQQDCETQIAALNVKYTLFTPDGTPAPPFGPDSLLLLALFAPPDKPDDFASARLLPVAAAGVRFQGEGIMQVVNNYGLILGLDGNLWVESPGGGFQPASVDDHPDFVWLPTYNPDQAKSSLYFPEDMLTEIKGEMYLLLILLPEAPDIAGLFKDTAAGESGDTTPAFVGDSLLRVLEVQPGTSADSPAVYNFSLNGDEGLVIFNPFEFPVQESTVWGDDGSQTSSGSGSQTGSTSGLQTSGGAIVIGKPLGVASFSADTVMPEVLPATGMWRSVGGMSFESEVVDYSGPICTPTPSSTPSPTPSGTPTPQPALATPISTPAGGGGVPAPSPTREPPRPTDVPWNPPPSSPTREPPRPTDTPREPEPTRAPDD
jgi:hypothetical protein